MSIEEKSKFEEARSKGIAESWKTGKFGERLTKKKAKDENKVKKVNAEEKERIEKEKKKESEEVGRLVHLILGDQNYNAQEIVNDMKGVGGADFKMDANARKFVFIQWFLADPKTRAPQTLYELCKIIEMPLITGRDWMESDWFVSDLQAAMQKSMKLAMPYIGKMMLVKGLNGDFNAMKEFARIFGKHEKKEGESDWNDLFSEEVLKDIETANNAEN